MGPRQRSDRHPVRPTRHTLIRCSRHRRLADAATEPEAKENVAESGAVALRNTARFELMMVGLNYSERQFGFK